MSKDFNSWNTLKQELDKLQKPPFFNEREIWWCSVGLNVGYEIFGKDNSFTRPVLILKKYSHLTFLGLPMTSKRKIFPSHFHFDFQSEKGSLLLDQGRTFDARRLHSLMGYVGKKRFQKIHNSFFEYNSI